MVGNGANHERTTSEPIIIARVGCDRFDEVWGTNEFWWIISLFERRSIRRWSFAMWHLTECIAAHHCG